MMMTGDVVVKESTVIVMNFYETARCPDAVAIVANLSKHLRYISSSVTYIKDHLKRSTDFLKASQVSAQSVLPGIERSG